MRRTVVCISSQDGAGAAEAATLVASTLGFRLIDEDIVMRAAVEAGVHHDVFVDLEQRKSLLIRLVEGMGSAGTATGYAVPGAFVATGLPASEDLRAMIRAVIEDTAVEGSAVIVAHAASHALADREDVLRVLLTAPRETRERRIAAALGVSDKDAAKTLKRSDAAREDYLKRFYGINVEQPTHYDLVVNTDKLAPEDAAELIVQAAAGRSAAI